MFLAALLALILVAVVCTHVAQKRRRDAVANLNGPFCVPALGAVHKFFGINPKNFLRRSVEYRRRYGEIVRIWAFNRLLIVSGDVELNEQLLTSQQHIVKQRNYRILHQWLGVGLLMSDGKKWFTRRKIITPAFHFKILEEFVEIFDQQSQTFIERLAAKADGTTTFDIYPFVCLVALDIIAETSMGTKIQAQLDKGTTYADAVNNITKLMAWRFMKPYLNNESIFTIMYPHKKLQQMKLIKTMHEFTTKVIEERRQTLKTALAQKVTPNEDDCVGSKKHMALLDILLQSTIDGKPLSNEDIREEVDTFMFEGHDTTTSALSFALHLIARHPAVQAKLLNEIKNVLGNYPDTPITLRTLNELKYIECVIKETLRLYPSVPIIGREIQEDFKYTHSKLGDGFIPAGAEFMIAIHAMMRSPARFEKANEFIPERHENNDVNNSFALVPFSAGPRNCIGQKFAMLEMKIIIAKVVREYELLPFGEDVQPEINIVLRSSNGFQLGLKKRT